MDERISLFLKNPLKSFYILLYRLRILRNPSLIRASLPFNKKMYILVPEHVSTHIFLRGIHEPVLTNTLRKIVKRGMCTVDVGAHFGYFSLLLSSLVGNSGEVHSFEPTKSTFNMLSKNCKNERNIIINNIAIYSKKDKISFNDFGLLYSAFNSCNRKLKSSSNKTYIIDSISLDFYFKKRKKKPDFIKIDAEGAELDILYGMENILKKYGPIISMEVGDIDINDQHSKKCVLFLKKLGYEPYLLSRNKFIHQILKEKYTYDNLIFFHAKHHII